MTVLLRTEWACPGLGGHERCSAHSVEGELDAVLCYRVGEDGGL